MARKMIHRGVYYKTNKEANMKKLLFFTALVLFNNNATATAEIYGEMYCYQGTKHYFMSYSYTNGDRRSWYEMDRTSTRYDGPLAGDLENNPNQYCSPNFQTGGATFHNYGCDDFLMTQNCTSKSLYKANGSCGNPN